jgi:hypothetical protein
MLASLALMFALGMAEPDGARPTPGRPSKTCRESEVQTGSHIRSGRRCKTAEEWAREDQEKGRLSPSARVTEGQGDALTKTAPPN